MMTRMNSVLSLGLVLIALSQTGANVWTWSTPATGQDISKNATIACGGMVEPAGIAYTCIAYKNPPLFNTYAQGTSGTSQMNSWSCALPPPGTWTVSEHQLVVTPQNGDGLITRNIDIID